MDKMTIFDDIDATSFGFQESKRIWQGQHHKDFFHDTQTRHGFHMQSSQKHPRLEIGWESSSQSSEYEEDKKSVAGTS